MSKSSATVRKINAQNAENATDNVEKKSAGRPVETAEQKLARAISKVQAMTNNNPEENPAGYVRSVKLRFIATICEIDPNDSVALEFATTQAEINKAWNDSPEKEAADEFVAPIYARIREAEELAKAEAIAKKSESQAKKMADAISTLKKAGFAPEDILKMLSGE